MIRKHITVSGLVQGVFYRDTCRTEARAHGVSGWVRNRPDGTVEAVFEGPAEAVDHMIRWAHHGPARAAVQSVDAHDEPPQGLTDFEVRPTSSAP
ncbi:MULTISPECIES: acylphosphatase [Streptomyces]|uniref:acylphosphatase n=1 Tax=Streptomyces morookaense TaxID=1970 RepID=A0A7Y7B317_STRMO|nr:MULTISPECIES: acylphosphatase [Streptomyces]MCC2279561.1 acylphosphatase [Streptomyces sp. ET3-23]NVK78067.1 acylphosphatase [Streptomyces morookaense]